MSLEELPVAVAERFQRQGQLFSEEEIADSGRAEDQSAADVAGYVQRWPIFVLAPLGQYLIAHEARVQARNLLHVVFRTHRQEQLSCSVRVG